MSKNNKSQNWKADLKTQLAQDYRIVNFQLKLNLATARIQKKNVICTIARKKPR